VRRDQVAVVAGHTARRKVVEVDGLDVAELERRLDKAVSDR